MPHLFLFINSIDLNLFYSLFKLLIICKGYILMFKVSENKIFFNKINSISIVIFIWLNQPLGYNYKGNIVYIITKCGYYLISIINF